MASRGPVSCKGFLLSPADRRTSASPVSTFLSPVFARPSGSKKLAGGSLTTPGGSTFHSSTMQLPANGRTLKPEDFSIEPGEVLAVNCMYGLRKLADETVSLDSPRDKALNNIRRLNPKVFVVGVVNGTYNAPFFVTRFREALFHFSALFDMLETNVEREDEQRRLLEKYCFERELHNVISCEGLERVERPETYKQWRLRNERAGLELLPLDSGIVRKAKEKVKKCYHKDFLVDEDGKWLLQGWKGRILFAWSAWKAREA